VERPMTTWSATSFTRQRQSSSLPDRTDEVSLVELADSKGILRDSGVRSTPVQLVGIVRSMYRESTLQTQGA